MSLEQLLCVSMCLCECALTRSSPVLLLSFFTLPSAPQPCAFVVLLPFPLQLAGGPHIPMRYGREDVLDAAQCAPEGRLPCELCYGNVSRGCLNMENACVLSCCGCCAAGVLCLVLC